MLRVTLHYGIHFILPIIIGFLFFKKNRGIIILILLAGISIDVDHLLASPIFNPNRCSIGFHPLHGYLAIGLYLLLFAIKKTRVIGLALCLHIMADLVDCFLLRLNF
ncbi:MAG: hypothetical protein HKP24_01455 [Croceitalea sp.]|nr:hypothetical protein [Croceitalea sp.]NNC35104.1 hypothetical protein [Croceitalea sp.]NNM17212.1 hypothetical protein [Croceitalea sp.]